MKFEAGQTVKVTDASCSRFGDTGTVLAVSEGDTPYPVSIQFENGVHPYGEDEIQLVVPAATQRDGLAIGDTVKVECACIDDCSWRGKTGTVESIYEGGYYFVSAPGQQLSNAFARQYLELIRPVQKTEVKLCKVGDRVRVNGQGPVCHRGKEGVIIGPSDDLESDMRGYDHWVNGLPGVNGASLFYDYELSPLPAPSDAQISAAAETLKQEVIIAQNKHGHTIESDQKKTLGDFLVYTQNWLDKAKEAYSSHDPLAVFSATIQFRKVGGLVLAYEASREMSTEVSGK